MLLAQKASLAFKKYEPAAKIPFGQAIVSNLIAAAATTDNPFTNLPVSIADLHAANNALIITATAALTGAYIAITNLEAAQKDWNKKFGHTANYVSIVASTSKAPAQVICRAGFKPTKEATTPNPLPVASNNFIVFNNGKKGAIVAKSQTRIDNAQGYVFAALPDDATVEFEEKVMKITMGGKTCYIAADTRLKVEMFNMPQTPLKVFVYGFNAAGSGPACSVVKITPGVLHSS